MIAEPQQPTFEDLELLVEVSKLLTLHDLGEVMEEVMRLTASAVGATKASLFLLDGVHVNWEYVFTARNLDAADSVRVVSKVLNEGLAGWTVKHRQPSIAADTHHDPRWHVFPEDTDTARSAMCVPLITDNEIIAVLTLVHPQPNRFNDYHLRLMTIIANQATIAVRNSQLFKNLVEKQRQLEVVLRAVPDVLLVLDASANLVMLNDGAEDLLGDSADRAVGTAVERYADQAEALQEVMYRLANSDIAIGEQISFETRDTQKERDFLVTISAWEDTAKQRRGYVVIMHDVTTLRDLFRFKDEMLRIVSHDLRSPLSIISGYTDMIEYDLAGNEGIMEFTGAIKRSITRMSDLLENLLQVRKIDETGLDPEPNVVMLDIVRPVMQGAAMLTYQKKQTLHDEISFDESVLGTVDQVLLRQAMDNLVGNAVKYTDEGGKIIVRAYEHNGNFCFEVEDNGIGIPEASIPHLFESFYRVNPKANTSIDGGVGLGLSLVKSIVDRHRGELWVKSEEGVGSTFGMCIPLER